MDESFLSDIEKVIESKEDLAVLEELGADKSFIKQRTAHLEKFLKKISVKKEKPKKRVAPPIHVESKYRNGAVMVFQFEDETYGALISVDSKFYDKETYHSYVQTDIKMSRKPSIDDVRKARIIDPSFHSKEYNSFRDPAYYYSFVYCISGYLKSTGTKKSKSTTILFLKLSDIYPIGVIAAAEPLTASIIIDKRRVTNLK